MITFEFLWRNMCHLMLSFITKSAITVWGCFQAISRRFWGGLCFVLLVAFCAKRRPWPNSLKTTNIIVPRFCFRLESCFIYFQAISRRFWKGSSFLGLRSSFCTHALANRTAEATNSSEIVRFDHECFNFSYWLFCRFCTDTRTTNFYTVFYPRYNNNDKK